MSGIVKAGIGAPLAGVVVGSLAAIMPATGRYASAAVPIALLAHLLWRDGRSARTARALLGARPLPAELLFSSEPGTSPRSVLSRALWVHRLGLALLVVLSAGSVRALVAR